MFSLLLGLLLAPIVALLLTVRWIRGRKTTGIAFVHPYCEMGGGGEVVLWKMLQILAERHPTVPLFVYTRRMSAAEEAELRRKVAERFDFDPPADRLRFVQTKSRWLLEPENYPRLTLFFQQYVGGLLFALECVCRLNPTVAVESTGIPAALPVFRLLGGCRVLVYMHYPTITTNMIARVAGREARFNNAAFIARSGFLTAAKARYYRLFAALYRLCGRCADVLVVNGSFTAGHIRELWPQEPRLCFPPVALDSFAGLRSTAERRWAADRELRIVSLAQFRPEKNHRAQLETLAVLKKTDNMKVKLLLVGGVRNDGDRRLVEDLRRFARELELREGEDFEFEINLKLEEIRTILESSLVALHTMVDEHFGIAVVELMAAGLLTVAHNSGGPRLDIIAEEDGRAGFLGDGPEDYARIIRKVAAMSAEEREEIRRAARRRAERFALPEFQRQIAECFRPLLDDHKLSDGQ
ncbi:GDP-Man:Man(3)GlcNAc(2)-PP-Dol alpha-1,2-mannosyltransferase [Aphelenchoides fujianensis]|nr:GDP-Man:Man(3)GlcNAc(2)-PP-Dol alpha-1,2-mannosyltransferase [Aphelenchoides fujianensis]